MTRRERDQTTLLPFPEPQTARLRTQRASSLRLDRLDLVVLRRPADSRGSRQLPRRPQRGQQPAHRQHAGQRTVWAGAWLARPENEFGPTAGRRGISSAGAVRQREGLDFYLDTVGAAAVMALVLLAAILI